MTKSSISGDPNVRRERPTDDPREEGESHNDFDLLTGLGEKAAI